MIDTISKYCSHIIPVRFLKPRTKLVDGERFPLDPDELRECLERSISHRANSFLDKFSPGRRIKKSVSNNRVEKKRVALTQLIGETALSHAKIEQNLKATLVGDWDVPIEFKEQKYENKIPMLAADGTPSMRNVNIARTFGRNLKCRFLKEVKKKLIPPEFETKYIDLFKKFDDLSKKRNDIVKTIYTYDANDGTVSRFNEMQFHTVQASNVGYEAFMETWMPAVNLNDIRSLNTELTDLGREFDLLRATIFRDKIDIHMSLCCEVGVSYPIYVSKNPYVYQAQLDTLTPPGAP